MAQPTVTYVVLPVKYKAGQQIVLNPVEDINEAKREATRMTACTGDQHVVYTSTHYTDPFQEWLQSTIDEIVLPYTP